MNRALRFIDTLNRWVGAVVKFLIVIISLVVFYEVIARYVFNRPTTWANELTSMLFGAYLILGGGYTLLIGNHVNMDLIYAHLPARAKAILDLITFWVFFLFCGALVWKAWESAWWSLAAWEHSGSIWNPPVYPIKVVLPLGAFLLLLQGMAKFVRDVLILARGAAHEH